MRSTLLCIGAIVATGVLAFSGCRKSQSGTATSSTPSASAPTSPTPATPSLNPGALADDLAKLLSMMTEKWFEATTTLRLFGYPKPSDTSWVLACPLGGSMEITGFGSSIGQLAFNSFVNWTSIYTACAFATQGQTVAATGQMALTGGYSPRLLPLPWEIRTEGQLTLSSYGAVPATGKYVGAHTSFEGILGTTPVALTTRPSVAPFPSASQSSLRVLCGVPDLVVPLGASTGCNAPVVYTDGAVTVEPAVTWASSNSSVLSIKPNGNSVTITPRQNGGAVLRATYQNLQASLGIGTGNGSPPPSDPGAPAPGPTPDPAPPSSCSYQLGCLLSVIYNGSLSSATDFDLYISSGGLTCKYPKTGSGASSSLCFGPGCNGDSLRTGSRQFSVLPRFSNATVSLVKSPSSGPSTTTRSVNLTSCSPDTVTFP